MKEDLIRKVYWTVAAIVILVGSLYFINPFKKTEWPESIIVPSDECNLGIVKQLKELGSGHVYPDEFNNLYPTKGPKYHLMKRTECECYWEKIEEAN